MIHRIGSANFAPSSNNYIFTREYLSASIWDIRINRSPIQTLNVTEYLDKNLVVLFESDKIFDTFPMSVSPCST